MTRPTCFLLVLGTLLSITAAYAGDPQIETIRWLKTEAGEFHYSVVSAKTLSADHTKAAAKALEDILSIARKTTGSIAKADGKETVIRVGYDKKVPFSKSASTLLSLKRTTSTATQSTYEVEYSVHAEGTTFPTKVAPLVSKLDAALRDTKTEPKTATTMHTDVRPPKLTITVTYPGKTPGKRIQK